jgi:predicted RNase H-like nuclease
MIVAGVDGCTGGWVCVARNGFDVTAFIEPSMSAVIARLGGRAIVAVDVPIGLTEQGARTCDLEARKILGQPRGTSVFPAPVRAALRGRTHVEASDLHEHADGRRMTRQAFGILAKIREVDSLLVRNPRLQQTIREIHPELSFTFWNAGQPMRHRKSRLSGRSEREVLIEKQWPGTRRKLVGQLRGQPYKPDDLNDALAALWTAERIQSRTAERIPNGSFCDRFGLKMEMWA